MQQTASVSRGIISEHEYLDLIIGRAIANNYSLAVWRLPDEHSKHLILSRQPQHLAQDELLEDLPTGFIAAPFDKSGGRIFLPADLSFTFSNQTLSAPTHQLEIASAAWLDTQWSDSPLPNKKYYALRNRPDAGSKNAFVQMVETGIREIERGTFEKIVPSRVSITTLSPHFDIVQAFETLCEKNPNAFVSLVSTPETGTWLGATPELLVNVSDNTTFKTIALAGTQSFHAGMDLRKVAWTQKDIEEQALVERYIVNCFKKIRLREFEEHGPKTVIAGNLLHLKSEFKVDMEATKFPQLGSIMLKLLHPTSAVCGVPLEPAQAFIRQFEGYDRQYYSGYLGPVNFENSINIFVNLRCAQLLQEHAVVYAGAGVTADSVPELEWQETEIKMNALRNVLDT